MSLVLCLELAFNYVALLATPAPLSVTVNGASLAPIQAGSDGASAGVLAASASNACYYNESLRTTFIKVFDKQASATVIGTFPC